jgi:hypothetical protein
MPGKRQFRERAHVVGARAGERERVSDRRPTLWGRRVRGSGKERDSSGFPSVRGSVCKERDSEVIEFPCEGKEITREFK